MKICVVGGIFDKPKAYREVHHFTPETILADGLRRARHEVNICGHKAFRPSSNFDIVHIHHIADAAILMSSAAGRSKYVLTTHNGPFLSNYQESNLRRFAYRYAIAKADAVVALTEIEARFLRDTIPSLRRVMIIPNGIDSDVFRPGEASGRQMKKYKRLLYVGQLIPLKGVDILLQAVKHVLRKVPIELVLVYQNASREQEYRTLASSLGISDRVKFLGMMNPEALAELYRDADVTVLPSFAESLPSTLSESMLSGTPVVATEVGGIPEQIGPYGVLTPPGDPYALAEAIILALQQFTKTASLSMEIRKYALHRYSIEGMVSAHLKLYNSILQSSHIDTPIRSNRMLDIAMRTIVEAKRWKNRN